MKHIVRYLLEGDGSVPKFIVDGGHLQIGAELIGLSVDDQERHLPSTVIKLTEEDLIERAALLDIEDPEAFVEAWLANIGFSYEQ